MTRLEHELQASVEANERKLAVVNEPTSLSSWHSASAAAPVFTAEQEQMIRDHYLNGANKAEAQVLLEVARIRRLNPLLKQIHFVKRWDHQSEQMKWASQVGIDGFRAIAERTGRYDGQDEPEFGPRNQNGFPEWAKVRVYKKGITRPFVGIAYWNEFVQKKRSGEVTKFWRDMPHNQLAKCAESLALRKAFPEDLGGLYTDEEMQQGERPADAPPRIAPDMDEDDFEPTDDSDAVFEELSSKLVTVADAIEAHFTPFKESKWEKVTASYEEILQLREMLGSKAKPSQLLKEMQVARERGALADRQRSELGKIWQRADRQLSQLETKVVPPDASQSFMDEGD